MKATVSTLVILLFCIPWLLSKAIGQETSLFSNEEILDITLSGAVNELLIDRGEEPQYHPISFSYATDVDQQVSMEIKAKTRGNFRRQKANCRYPPLWLNFSKENTPENSLFAGQDKLKLVMPCVQEKYIIREYLVYKLYQLVSENSFQARLVRVNLNDEKNPKKIAPLMGILLEGEEQMAERNNARIVEPKQLKPTKTDKEQFFKMAVFEYLVGNTDWSVQYRHNVKLIVQDSSVIPITVPYDFDHAGIVGAPYALPAQALELASIRDRRYRGYCLEDLSELDPVLQVFTELKADIYKLYTDCPLLGEKYIKQTSKYLDDFYKTLEKPKKKKFEFTYPCLKHGTGHIVIRGLNN